jgi:hypothetical protein
MTKLLTVQLKKAEEKYDEAMDILKYENPKRERALKLLQQAKEYGKIAGYNPTKQYEQLEKKYQLVQPKQPLRTFKKKPKTAVIHSDVAKLKNIHKKIIHDKLTPKEISSQLNIPEGRVRDAISARNDEVIKKWKHTTPTTQLKSPKRLDVAKKLIGERVFLKTAKGGTLYFGEKPEPYKIEKVEILDKPTKKGTKSVPILIISGAKGERHDVHLRDISGFEKIDDIGEPFSPEDEAKIKKKIMAHLTEPKTPSIKATIKKPSKKIKGSFYKGETWEEGLVKSAKNVDLFLEPVIKQTKKSAQSTNLFEPVAYELKGFQLRAAGPKYEKYKMKIPKEYEHKAISLFKTHQPETMKQIKDRLKKQNVKYLF